MAAGWKEFCPSISNSGRRGRVLPLAWAGQRHSACRAGGFHSPRSVGWCGSALRIFLRNRRLCLLGLAASIQRAGRVLVPESRTRGGRSCTFAVVTRTSCYSRVGTSQRKMPKSSPARTHADPAATTLTHVFLCSFTRLDLHFQGRSL